MYFKAAVLNSLAIFFLSALDYWGSDVAMSHWDLFPSEVPPEMPLKTDRYSRKSPSKSPQIYDRIKRAEFSQAQRASWNSGGKMSVEALLILRQALRFPKKREEDPTNIWVFWSNRQRHLLV